MNYLTWILQTLNTYCASKLILCNIKVRNFNRKSSAMLLTRTDSKCYLTPCHFSTNNVLNLPILLTIFLELLSVCCTIQVHFCFHWKMSYTVTKWKYCEYVFTLLGHSPLFGITLPLWWRSMVSNSKYEFKIYNFEWWDVFKVSNYWVDNCSYISAIYSHSLFA